jgi:hypothetical protein
MPKTFNRKKILFKGRYFNGIREITSYITRAIPQNIVRADSLIYEIPPLQSLKYPMKTESQWTYRHPGQPWQIDKKIVSYEKINVPAGSFDCYKIQWLYDIDQDGVWDTDIVCYDYICDKGLIQRSFFFKDVMIISQQSPEPIGLMDSKDESILTKLNF